MIKRFFSVSFSLVLLYIFYFKLSYGTEEVYIKYEVGIINKLIKDVTKKDKPVVYIKSPNKRFVYNFISNLKKYSNLEITYYEEDADFILIKDLKEKYSLKKPTLALDFNSLRKCQKCIGIFTWRNGRPLFIIFEEAITSLGIKLPKDYNYFIDKREYILGK